MPQPETVCFEGKEERAKFFLVSVTTQELLAATRFFKQNRKPKQTWMPSRVKRLLLRVRRPHVGLLLLLLHRVAVGRRLKIEDWSAATASTAAATAVATSASSTSTLEIASPAAPSAAHFLTRSDLRCFV